ncbi:MAG: glycosyltransferase family 4 protein, partial [Deltaproteobacteria bacterium]|nr:glycosyltransferase family 4 protein [Deltaproteobacteria bacterium]
ENLHDFYASLDIFVLPSREHDPFGLVAGEAMLCGIPVIVTDACGIAGYVKSESDAIVVPADDPQALRAAITSLMAHDAKREMIGREGRKTAERLFGMEKMVEGYERVIQTMESSP